MTGRRDDVPALEREALQAALDLLAQQPNALRQALADHQWSTISLMVDEFAYAANQATGAPLTVAAQTSGLELITSVVACVPAGATGLVQLGLMAIPVGAGVTIVAPVQKLLGATDARALTLAGSNGPAALWLTGQQMPTYGVLAR